MKSSSTKTPRKTHAAGHGLTQKQIRALAKTEQPIFLIGGGRFVRRQAADAIHRDLVDVALDVENPHPDLTILAPPPREDMFLGRSIGIDAVKMFVDKLCLTPYSSPLRVGFVEPASALTLESQNALLHYIEEPTATSRIIMSSRRAEDLIPTLLSRLLLVRLQIHPADPVEFDHLAERFGESAETIRRLMDILDDPDAVERLLDFRLAKNALAVYDVILGGAIPEQRVWEPFLRKRPAGEVTFLFVEVVFAAVCERLKCVGESEELMILARKLLVLQADLRYNPQRSVVFGAVLEWVAEVHR